MTHDVHTVKKQTPVEHSPAEPLGTQKHWRAQGTSAIVHSYHTHSGPRTEDKGSAIAMRIWWGYDGDKTIGSYTWI
jgi:hypothetical protein